MKIKIIFIFLVLLIPVNGFSQDFKTLKNGIEYAELTREIDKVPVRMNLLRLDLDKVRLDVVHANNGIIGTQTTSAMAARHKAFAAINAGFFRLDKSDFLGDPGGVFVINEKLLSESDKERIALLIWNTTSACTSCTIEKRTIVSMEYLKSYVDLYINDREVPIPGINRQIKENDIVMFTPAFGRTSPPSESKVLELVIVKNKLRRVVEGNGRTIIPKKGYVISASGKQVDEINSKLKFGKDVLLVDATYVDKKPTPEDMSLIEFRRPEDAVAGRILLLRSGQIAIDRERENVEQDFVNTKHPRTAVAKLKDGKLLMITVDGRSESSGGINLNDLAALLLEMGATDAMNLDGGGSTTMVVDGKVVNKPSDKEGERKVSDALLVSPRRKQ